jgi:D-glycero-D-manno-heptose 1,7-bisphosphate phosphatase
LVTRACVFLDRDGVINRKPPEGAYIRSWAEFVLVPAVVDWIRLFNALGLLVIVVTNQRGVALGLMQQADVDEIHARMLAELNRRGARIDDVLCCPHAENSCDCRKPKPGMVLAASRKWDLDLSHSLLLGDSDRDRQLAANCGIPYLAVSEGRLL